MKNIAIFLISVIVLLSCNEKKKEKTKETVIPIEKSDQPLFDIKDIYNKETYVKTLDLRKEFVGRKRDEKYVSETEKKYGKSKMIGDGDINWYVEYYPDGNITTLMNKKTKIIINVCVGKNPEIIYDHTFKFFEYIDKKMKWEDYQNVFDISIYGISQKITEGGCVNKDCVEWYREHNFTTVAYYDNSNPQQHYVTLKKIFHGRHPELIHY